jgi:hypothetical protein
MPKVRRAAFVFLLCVAAVGVGACSSNTSTTSTTAASGTTSTKTAFCGYNITLDKGSSNVSSAADFLTFLKANKAALDGLAKNIPNDSIRADAQSLVAAARAAVAANDANTMSSPSLMADGAAMDTYCGVQGDGAPLPANFAAGKGTAFCADEAAISAGVSSAATPAAAVAFLVANQAKISDFAANIPSAVQSDAQSLVTAARAAIASNDGSQIETQAVSTASNNVDLYCGVNH